jgi:CBS domain containing-hemolysin-like protein
MIHEIIKLGDKTAKDCMTPRIDTFNIPDDLPNEEAIRRIRKERHRRVPVYGDTPDDIVGILDVKTFLFDTTQPYTEVMIPPSFVSETMNALDLLRSFLRHRQGLAVIVDEYGGTEGIVTLADIVEEIISDAVPDADSAPYIERLEDGRLLASGNARLDDLGERLGVDIEEEGLDTIGGLVFNRLGYLPKAGATLRIGDLSLTVRRTSKKRVEEIIIAVDPAGESEETP